MSVRTSAAVARYLLVGTRPDRCGLIYASLFLAKHLGVVILGERLGMRSGLEAKVGVWSTVGGQSWQCRAGAGFWGVGWVRSWLGYFRRGPVEAPVGLAEAKWTMSDKPLMTMTNDALALIPSAAKSVAAFGMGGGCSMFNSGSGRAWRGGFWLRARRDDWAELQVSNRTRNES